MGAFKLPPSQIYLPWKASENFTEVLNHRVEILLPRIQTFPSKLQLQVYLFSTSVYISQGFSEMIRALTQETKPGHSFIKLSLSRDNMSAWKQNVLWLLFHPSSLKQGQDFNGQMIFLNSHQHSYPELTASYFLLGTSCGWLASNDVTSSPTPLKQLSGHHVLQEGGKNNQASSKQGETQLKSSPWLDLHQAHLCTECILRQNFYFIFITPELELISSEPYTPPAHLQYDMVRLLPIVPGNVHRSSLSICLQTHDYQASLVEHMSKQWPFVVSSPRGMSHMGWGLVILQQLVIPTHATAVPLQGEDDLSHSELFVQVSYSIASLGNHPMVAICQSSTREEGSTWWWNTSLRILFLG